MLFSLACFFRCLFLKREGFHNSVVPGIDLSLFGVDPIFMAIVNQPPPGHVPPPKKIKGLMRPY